MRYQSVMALILAPLWASPSQGSVSEVEQNSTVTGTTLVCLGLAADGQTCAVRQIVETDSTGTANPNANLDPSKANMLSIADGGETIGHIDSPRDYDWYYLDINDTSHPETPVYFGCDFRHGTIIYESPFSEFSATPDNVSWDVGYYYDNNPNDATPPVYRGSYPVLPSECKRGTATTKGPFRFQMNTQQPGRYYVRIWGDLVNSNVEFKDSVKDANGDDVDRLTYYDQIAVQTADYSLSVFTSRQGSKVEPNDGRAEAYGLSSGTAVTDQLSSMYDQDWFYIDSDASQNTTGKVPFYFKCAAETGKLYFLSAYDKQNTAPINSYEINSAQCSGSGGFLFTLSAPTSDRYYFKVSSPTFTESAQFSQSDYTVLAITNNSGVSGTASRLPGELEPNETPVNAYQLTDTLPITAQLSSVTDLDYYYYDNDTGKNPSGTVPINFYCQDSGGSALYTLSYFNTQGFLQQAYTVGDSQCSAENGFQFNINTPATARYYVLVSGPPGNDATTFSNGDYTLSAFVNLAALPKANATGVLRKASIVNGSKDSFAISLKQCGTKKGSIRLTGQKLNLAKQSKNTQVKVEIGGWSCVSDTKELGVTTDPSTGATIYSYPKLVTPTKEPKGAQLSGTN
jgi:hypothetical protein